MVKTIEFNMGCPQCKVGVQTWKMLWVSYPSLVPYVMRLTLLWKNLFEIHRFSTMKVGSWKHSCPDCPMLAHEYIPSSICKKWWWGSRFKSSTVGKQYLGWDKIVNLILNSSPVAFVFGPVPLSLFCLICPQCWTYPHWVYVAFPCSKSLLPAYYIVLGGGICLKSVFQCFHQSAVSTTRYCVFWGLPEKSLVSP